jgi:N-methylhydantoinase A
LLRVGPHSAGAVPGPVCYGAGGSEVTVTDANLVLGRLNPAYFLGGRLTLDLDLARRQIRSLGAWLGLGEAETAEAILDVANENMANALRVLSIDRGLDPRDFALVAFGGAGPLQAASIARMMGMSRVVVPPYPGLCSAIGTLLADLQVNRVLSTNHRSDSVTAAALEEGFARLAAAALEELRQEGYRGEPSIERSVSMRYWGQNYEHDVAVPDGPIDDAVLGDLLRAFDRRHEQFYGYSIGGEVIELIRFNLTVTGPVPKPTLTLRLPAGPDVTPHAERAIYFRGDGFVTTPVYRRDALPAHAHLAGPALVEDVDSTILIHPSQQMTVDAAGLVNIAVPRES